MQNIGSESKIHNLDIGLLILKFLKKLRLKRKRCDLESEILTKMMKAKAKIRCIQIKTIYRDEHNTINPFKDSLRFFRTLYSR